jgi:hypothetical protein
LLLSESKSLSESPKKSMQSHLKKIPRQFSPEAPGAMREFIEPSCSPPTTI